MKNQSSGVFWLVLVVIVLGLIGWIIYAYRPAAPASSGTGTTTASSSAPDNAPFLAATSTLYSNSDLQFSFGYPSDWAVVPQNFMDVRGQKTVLILSDPGKSSRIRVVALL